MRHRDVSTPRTLSRGVRGDGPPLRRRWGPAAVRPAHRSEVRVISLRVTPPLRVLRDIVSALSAIFASDDKVISVILLHRSSLELIFVGRAFTARQAPREGAPYINSSELRRAPGLESAPLLAARLRVAFSARLLTALDKTLCARSLVELNGREIGERSLPPA